MYKTERNCSPMLKIRAQACWNLCGLGNFHLLCHTCLSAKLLQSCPTLWDLVDCSPPGFSIRGILQARILEWVAMTFSRGSSQTRDRTHIFFVSCIDRCVLYQHYLGSPKQAYFHSIHYNWLKFFPLYGWVIFHYINVSQILYSFIYQWTSRFLLCPGYYK